MRVYIGHIWITGRECIGIVASLDEENLTEPYKAHIAVVPGLDPIADLKYIKDRGAKYPFAAAVTSIDISGTWASTHEGNKAREYAKLNPKK